MDELSFSTATTYFLNGTEVHVIYGHKGLDPRSLLRKEIILNGKRVMVVGVEIPAIVDPTGCNFSVLVK